MIKHNHYIGSGRHSFGFTVIELIIVIVIIGILVSMAAVKYADTQAQSRDTKRNTDITILQNELEKFYDQYGEYPPGCPAASCSDTQLTTNLSTTTHITSSATVVTLKTILPGLSNDFGDPRYPGQTPMAVASTATTKYFYYGGTVNYTGTTTSLAKNTPTPVCTINVSLAPGQVGSYVVGYFSEQKKQWVLKSGLSGKIMTVTAGAAADGCVINLS